MSGWGPFDLTGMTVEHQATYAVDMTGAVRPEDANAASLERLAQRLARHGGILTPDSFGAPEFR